MTMHEGSYNWIPEEGVSTVIKDGDESEMPETPNESGANALDIPDTSNESEVIRLDSEGDKMAVTHSSPTQCVPYEMLNFRK